MIKTNQGNAKELWKVINKIMGWEKQTNSVNINLDSVFGCDVADAFNNYFVNIIHNDSDIDDVNVTTSFRDFLNSSPLFSFYLFPCNELEIKGNINSLKSNSAGYDKITATLLKQTIDHISAPLSHLINLSFRHGVFSDKLKIAKSLQQISTVYYLLLAKYLKKAIAHRLTNFLENDNSLSNCQLVLEGIPQHSQRHYCILFQKLILN